MEGLFTIAVLWTIFLILWPLIIVLQLGAVRRHLWYLREALAPHRPVPLRNHHTGEVLR